MATAKKTAAKPPAAKAPVAKKAPAAGAKRGKAAAKGEAKKTEKAARPEKSAKPRKPKLVRDSFTIPKPEYAVLEELKQRAAGLGRPTKKSEVLRAGIKALAAMADDAFLASVGAVPTVKTGRPAKA
jgi:hypothetical protein